MGEGHWSREEREREKEVWIVIQSHSESTPDSELIFIFPNFSLISIAIQQF